MNKTLTTFFVTSYLIVLGMVLGYQLSLYNFGYEEGRKDLSDACLDSGGSMFYLTNSGEAHCIKN